jgi:hypothetical protein
MLTYFSYDTAIINFGNNYLYQMKKRMKELDMEIELMTLMGVKKTTLKFRRRECELQSLKERFINHHIKLLKEIHRKNGTL